MPDAAQTCAEQTPRYAEKQEAILAAAANVFNEKGVRGATLSDVANRVGLGTTSITYYYKKKADLAVACFMRAVAAFDQLARAAATEPTPAARVAACVSGYFALLGDIAAGRRAALIAFDDIRALEPPYAAPIFEAYTDMFRRVRTLFRGEQNLTRPEQNARAHLLLSVLLWVPAWSWRYEVEDYGRLAERVTDILLYGLGRGDFRLEPVPADDIGAGTTGTMQESFLRSATELINERGYRGASVDKIAARISVTKGAFYHHNNGKDEVVVACFERTFDVLRCTQNAAASRGGTGWQQLSGAAVSLVRYQMSKQGPLLRTSALHAVAEPVRQAMVLRMNRLSDRFAAFIVDGIADGSIRPVDPFVAGQLVNAMINAAAELNRWVPGMDAESAPGLYIRPLLSGMLWPALTA